MKFEMFDSVEVPLEVYVYGFYVLTYVVYVGILFACGGVGSRVWFYCMMGRECLLGSISIESSVYVINWSVNVSGIQHRKL